MTSRLIAQMKAASSRATAVATTRTPLAFALEKPEAPAQSRLGFPRDLPDRPRRGCHLRLLHPPHACRMPIGPGRFDQEAAIATALRDFDVSIPMKASL
jgi:hypothetical protein